MARRLKAKPAALAARSKAPANSAEVHAARAAGEPVGALAGIMAAPLELQIETTPAKRLADATAALALLEAAVRLASDARTALIMAGVGASNPAAVYASQMVSAGLKAEQGTRYVIKTVSR